MLSTITVYNFVCGNQMWKQDLLVTCYNMKRDHFVVVVVNIEFLVWVDTPFSVEYSDESFKRKY